VGDRAADRREHKREHAQRGQSALPKLCLRGAILPEPKAALR
jgi:hypothetical protein